MKTLGVVQATKAYSSLWDGLSEHLIANFFEVWRGDGREWVRKPDSADVYAPLTEASMEVMLNWQSPFEQAGPESKAPALMALAQSGTLQPVIDALGAAVSGTGTTAGDMAADLLQKSAEFAKGFEGRTGITKLNSTQVFNGTPPVKIQVMALFRAWRDAASEVEAPFNKLMEWALPVYLDKDSTLLSRAAEAVRGSREWVDALMPSLSPVKIGMTYKGRTYAPLVIESISQPLDSPVDKNGRFVELVVPMTLCTLTAIDRKDWAGWATPI